MKKGFTLIEMLIVLAIIVILASVAFFNGSEYMRRAVNSSEVVSVHQDSMAQVYDNIKSSILFSEGMCHTSERE